MRREWDVTVTRIIDGDTFEGTVHTELLDVPMDIPKRKFRLMGVQAPEKYMPGGRDATMWLQDYLMHDYVTGAKVKVLFTGAKSFDRFVVEVLVGGVNLNIALVESGHAVYYEY